ncbi:dihydrolipoyl dehydrogenase [Aetokthonos hydrillicola Thurmond2011]|jgi:dihydrolipoamide dehydrogenase|uniref:Dihydrolipoyl dehydrogenase n=1 Tax=Aetokthonos hydrillicola Thurmond2011 TaxID=2712845 RepID=A0AAP5IEK6_9CYAN|nr:dihydrolipoyl dehydrogenase [Aetokthonos hydrillicola]MBO3463088.1 dihydrolipoyl dehydrogenase [Aetokthonos hydrillicola CCALA 1050]MBW4587031.1 dihydrolipoyl dehydrogenase [Aetokthonos hydrillicola CCALA 1050]MDR9897495.1 dihydrolipoyl dehydrogenase [Aetokthonos hydrillicola Thurmond2011]
MSEAVIKPISVPPMDQYNQELINNLHPPNWVNPEPAPCYNLVIIGAGTAGLVTAAGAGLFGAKVALVEKHLMGGDCTNVGCVPSKTMIRSARVVADIQHAAKFGINASGYVDVDFHTVMRRLRKIRAQISPHDSAKRFQEEFGVDVFFGEAKFSSPNTVEVAGKNLLFKKAAIATGTRPAKLPIEGLEEVGYLTNETVFSLTQCPQRLAVIGSGYIGCELAQTFSRLGSRVFLLQRGSRVLSREDADAAEILQKAFMRDGIQLLLESKIKRVERQQAEKVIYYEVDGQEQVLRVDEILVATGRTPNVEDLNLDVVNVKHDPKQGIIVNDYLQTSNPRIYAVGDVCMQWRFTHAADAAARIVIQNALFSIFGLGRKKLSSLTMPWCTYTDPEVAHVGMYPQQAMDLGIEVDTFCVPLQDVDRAIIDGETEGFAKIHVKKRTDKILGATIVARHAGEMISEITLAMTNNLGLKAIAKTIHPYPTQAEVIRKAADAYIRKSFMTPAVKKLTSTWFSWNR